MIHHLHTVDAPAAGEPGRGRTCRPEQLAQALASHQPICFGCYVAATFRREHPELVLDNPWKP